MRKPIKIPEGILLLKENIITRGNLFGLPLKEKTSWTEGLKLAKEGDTLLFTGCGYEFLDAAGRMTSVLQKRGRSIGFARAMEKFGLNLPGIYAKAFMKGDGHGEVLKATVKVLQEFEMEFAYLGEEEPCCGAPLYFFGFHKDFAERAKKTLSFFKKRDLRKIIGMVPSCTYALKELYPRFLDDFDIEVKFILEVLSEQMPAMKLSKPTIAVYHDPCLLSRYLGIREEPREILRKVENLELREPEWTRKEWSTCCGGGGGFEVVFPELSLLLAQRRIEELLELEPQVIATSCPGCLLQLEEGLRRTNTEGVEIVDLVQILEKAWREDELL